MSYRQILRGQVNSGEEHLKWCLEKLREGHPATENAKRILMEARERLDKEMNR